MPTIRVNGRVPNVLDTNDQDHGANGTAATSLALELEKIRIISQSVASGAPLPKAPAFLKYRPTPFQRQYRNRPDAFIADCIEWGAGQGPAPYQLEIAEQLQMKKRVAVRGPHTLGKTSLASWLVHWFALTRDGEDWKLPTTAGAWRQLIKYLWPEIHKWSRRLRWNLTGRGPYKSDELLVMSLKLRTGEAFAVASSNHELIEGAHADSLFTIFDESKAIPGSTFDALEGAFAGGSTSGCEAFALAISTPGDPVGRFHDIHKRKAGYEDWTVRHVTRAEAISAGRMSELWANQRLRQWGETSALYQNRVMGEFYAGDEDGVIPLAWVELANERWHELMDAGGVHGLPFTCLGADIAEGGTAKTVLAPRFQNAVSELKIFEKADLMATSGRIISVLRARGGYAVIDAIGIGAGVCSRVREEALQGVAFIAGAKCAARDRSNEFGFVNLRSAAWYNMREMLDPANGEDVALPPDDDLTGDLTAPKWQVKSGGKIAVESKGETVEGGKGVIERLGRSTDKGDSVVMAYVPRSWIPSSSGPIWVAV
jgi:hypothetical protein